MFVTVCFTDSDAKVAERGHHGDRHTDRHGDRGHSDRGHSDRGHEGRHRGHHKRERAPPPPRVEYDDPEEDDESTPIAPGPITSTTSAPARPYSGNRMNIPPDDSKQNVSSSVVGQQVACTKLLAA